MTIRPEQVRKARELLGWSLPQLASRVGLTAETIALFELGAAQLSSFEASVVAGTIESVGLEFLQGPPSVKRGLLKRAPEGRASPRALSQPRTERGTRLPIGKGAGAPDRDAALGTESRLTQ
jgi:hypothetical protein